VAHHLAASMLEKVRRGTIVPSPVLVEVDHLLSARQGEETARRFLRRIAGGEREVAYLTPGLLRRAVELNERYADLDLGLVDTALMAIAERHELPILTFDFRDFRATESASGPWRLVVDEATYARYSAPA
jgi:predicted nucleic acid-binding protein